MLEKKKLVVDKTFFDAVDILSVLSTIKPFFTVMVIER